MAAVASIDAPVLVMQDVVTRFGTREVHHGINLQVQRGEIFAVIGASGSGKSTLLREMILLQVPTAGTVCLLGTDLQDIHPAPALALRRRFGVLFQQGGLFSSLTVLENVGLPLREHRLLGGTDVDTVALAKLALVGLEPGVGAKYPFELSGGMLKRAALARALVLEPELLFLDEPTAGLDPHSAEGFDALILQLNQTLGLTVVMITHDLDLLWQVADRVAVLGDGIVQGVDGMEALSHLPIPIVRTFFEGPRARAARPAPKRPHCAAEALSKPR